MLSRYGDHQAVVWLVMANAGSNLIAQRWYMRLPRDLGPLAMTGAVGIIPPFETACPRWVEGWGEGLVRMVFPHL